MTKVLTALAPPTMKIKVVAPLREKALGIDWRVYLVFSTFQQKWILRAGTMDLARPSPIGSTF